MVSTRRGTTWHPCIQPAPNGKGGYLCRGLVDYRVQTSRAIASEGWRSRPFASTAKPSDPVRGPCMVGRMLAGCASSEYKEAIWQLSANCRWRLWTSFFHPVFAVLIHWQLRSQGEWKCKMPQPQTQYTFYSNFDGRPPKTYSQGGTDYQIMSGGGLHRGDSLRLT